MPELIIQNLFDKRIRIEEVGRTLLGTILMASVDMMHSCGGKGRCTTCKVIVEKGGDSLSPLSAFEKKCLELGHIRVDERLACQVEMMDSLTIRIPEEYKLPHISYSD